MSKTVATSGRGWTTAETALVARAWVAAVSIEQESDTHKLKLSRKQLVRAVHAQYLQELYARAEHEWRAAALSANSFDAFTARDLSRVDGGLDVVDPNFQPRSERSLDDKMTSLTQSYRLIAAHDGGSLPGSAGQLPWFKRPVGERATVLTKFRRVTITHGFFDLMERIHVDDPAGRRDPDDSVSEVSRPAAPSIGDITNTTHRTAEKRPRTNSSTSSDSAPSSPRAQRSRRSEEVSAMREVLHEVVDKAVAAMAAIAREQRDAMQRENEKTRQLLRELLGNK